MDTNNQHVLGSSKEDTLYDVLKVSANATITEIVNAYHTAKNAFSKDSMATYSLFSAEETKAELEKIEQAYLQLSNVERRRDYDRYLAAKEKGTPTASYTPAKPDTTAPILSSPSEPKASTVSAERLGDYSTVTGETLREIRERRALTIDDVSRITKIPTKFLKAIESEDPKNMPARVYLQGFVKNLATLYKLNPNETTKAYLAHVDSKSAT